MSASAPTYQEEESMNNKLIGIDFEKLVVQKLAKAGFWVHFIAPDTRGAQPFDVIAAKDGVTIVGDCKTSKEHLFRMSRLEENQKMAFEKWLACGNTEPLIFVQYNGQIKIVEYSVLKSAGKVDLDEV